MPTCCPVNKIKLKIFCQRYTDQENKYWKIKQKKTKQKKVFYSTTTSKNNSKTCKIITPDKTSNTAKKAVYRRSTDLYF